MQLPMPPHVLDTHNAARSPRSNVGSNPIATLQSFRYLRDICSGACIECLTMEKLARFRCRVSGAIGDWGSRQAFSGADQGAQARIRGVSGV